MKTDKDGYKKTRDNISKHIVDYIEQLSIASKPVLNECLNVLNKLLYVIPVVFRGKQYKLFALGIILLACRKFNYPMTVQKIAKAAKLRKTKTLNNLLRTMKTLLPEYALYSQNPMNFMASLTRKLRLNRGTAKLACYIVSRITKERLLVGAHPNTVAGAAIFMSRKLRKEETENEKIAKAAECATQTIRNIYYKLEYKMEILFPRLPSKKSQEDCCDTTRDSLHNNL